MGAGESFLTKGHVLPMAPSALSMALLLSLSVCRLTHLLYEYTRGQCKSDSPLRGHFLQWNKQQQQKKKGV